MEQPNKLLGVERHQLLCFSAMDVIQEETDMAQALDYNAYDLNLWLTRATERESGSL